MRVQPDIDTASLAAAFARYHEALSSASAQALDALVDLDAVGIRHAILQKTMAAGDRRPSQIDVVFQRLEATESRLREALHVALSERIGEDQAAEVARMWRRRVIIDQQPPNTIDWSRLPDLDDLAATPDSPLHAITTGEATAEDAAAIWAAWDLEADAIVTRMLRGWSTLLRSGWRRSATGARQPTRVVGRAELELWRLMTSTVTALAGIARAHGEEELASAVLADFQSRACPHAWRPEPFDRWIEALASGSLPEDIASQVRVIAEDWNTVSGDLRRRAAALSWWDRTVLLQERTPTAPPERWLDINQKFVDGMVATSRDIQNLIDLDYFEDQDRTALDPQRTGPASPPMCGSIARRVPLPAKSFKQQSIDSYKAIYEQLQKRRTVHAPQDH